MLHILILCTGNSARSVLAECMFNHLGQGRVQAYSAGSHPTGKVNPFTLQALQAANIPCDYVSSKSQEVFAQADAPKLDLVITVCDNAANEVCPLFNLAGQQPVKAHWPYPDPAAVQGSDAEKLAAFQHVLAQLQDRIGRLLSHELTGLDASALKQLVQNTAKETLA
jgi:arsenate reductase